MRLDLRYLRSRRLAADRLMQPFQLIDSSYAVLRFGPTTDLFEIARDARAIVDSFAADLRQRIIIVEIDDRPAAWYWLGRSASWHPQRIAASNLPDALRRSNTYTYHAEVSERRTGWMVAIIVILIFGLLAGPALFRFFS